jgi:hypothetical protein
MVSRVLRILAWLKPLYAISEDDGSFVMLYIVFIFKNILIQIIIIIMFYLIQSHYLFLKKK